MVSVALLKEEKGRPMNQLKIGSEGCLEEGRKAGVLKERQEVASPR